MNAFFKALAVVVAVSAVAGLGIYSQFWTASAEPVSLSQDELNLFVEKNLGFREKTQFATDADARKKFLERLQKQLAIAMEAQRQGLGQTDEVKAVEELGAAQVLQDAYAKAHPDKPMGPSGPEVSPEEVKAWLDKNQDALKRYQAALAEQTHGAPNGGPKPEELAAVFVVADKARAEGLETSDPETRLQLKLNRYGALIQAFLPKLEEQAKYSDAEVDAYFAENKAKGELDQVHAAHILFATVSMPGPDNPSGGPAPDAAAKEQLATQVLQRVRAGEDFGELAKQYSDDPGSKDKGGDLGWSERFKFVPEFEDVAWKLQAGEVSDVVKSDFGFHIIKVIERKPPADLTDATRAELADSLAQKRFEKLVDDIAKRNPVQLPADFEVTAPPPMPQGMPGMPGGMSPHGGMDDGSGAMAPDQGPPPPSAPKGGKPAAKPAAKPAPKASH